MFVGGLDTNDQDEAGDWDGGGYMDERTGLELDMRLTKRAETEEIEFMKKICLCDVVRSSECWEKTGKPPISTKWVRVNKGTTEDTDIRCRLVARGFKPTG